MNENGHDIIDKLLELNHIDDPFGVAKYLVEMVQHLDKENRKLKRRLSQHEKRLTQIEKRLSQSG